MKQSLLQWLRCPKCKSELDLRSDETDSAETITGLLTCRSCDAEYPVVRSVPRFVSSDNYAGNFGYQWNLFAKTRFEDSLERFTKQVGFQQSDLEGKLVLEVGVGTARYADIVERSGATVIGIDLSNAVDAAYDNIGRRENAHIVQANVFELPFDVETFDLIYSIGVLHHTPDCHRAFAALPPLVRNGGALGICVYAKSGDKLEHAAENFYRSITTRMPYRPLLALCAVGTALSSFHPLKQALKWVLPRFIWDCLPKMHSGKTFKIRLQKNFDWYSPKYQSYQTYVQVFEWFEEAGMKDIRILPHRISVNAVRPVAS